MPLFYNLHRTKTRRQKLRREAPLAERILWQFLRGKQLGAKFRRQYGIRNFTVDFCCPTLKLVIELDGPYHQAPDVQTYDQKRQNKFEAYGWHVLRFANLEVLENIESVLEQIQAKIASLNRA